MAPWGGVNLGAVSQSFGITSTHNWPIYYTTDGSLPTKDSTLYTGAFSVSLPASSQAEVNARSYDSFTQTYSELATAHYRNYGFIAGDEWYSDNNYGQPVDAMSGNVTFTGGRYYMVGQYFQGGTNANISAAYDLTGGLRMFSSADFLNWHFEGTILYPSGVYQSHSRAAILFNQNTSKWVLWDHCVQGVDTNVPSKQFACVATADAITGPWTWQTLGLDPDGLGLKDMQLFKDDNGTGYVAYVDRDQTEIVISQLSSDYLTAGISHVIACACPQQESPVLFKKGSVYFLISGASNLTTYKTSIAQAYQTASSPLGTWSAGASLFSSDPVNTFFNAQPATVFVPNGKTDYVFLGDLWFPTPDVPQRSTHVALPLTFPTSTSLQASRPAVWDFSTLH